MIVIMRISNFVPRKCGSDKKIEKILNFYSPPNNQILIICYNVQLSL